MANQISTISELNPLMSGFSLVAKVISKTDLRNIKSGKEDSMVFSMELGDSTGRIRAVAFDSVAKDLYTKIDAGDVYHIQNVKVRQNLWKKVESKYELLVKRESAFEKVEDATVQVIQEVPPVTLLAELTPDKPTANILAVVRRVSDSTVGERRIKVVELVDVSEMGCLLTIWGSATDSDIGIGDVLMVKGATVSQFEGLSLSTSLLSTLVINPPDEEITAFLRDWDSKKIRAHEFPLIGAMERRRKVRNLSDIEKSGAIKASIETVLIDRKMTFLSKRSNQLEIVLKMRIKDQTGAIAMISAFDPHAKQLLNRSPEEIQGYQEGGDLKGLEDAIAPLEGKVFFMDVTKNGSDLIGKNFSLAD